MPRLEKRAQLLSREITDLARAQHAVEVLLDPDEPGLTGEEARVLAYRLLELEASTAASAMVAEALMSALAPYVESEEFREVRDVIERTRHELGDTLRVLEGTASISALTYKAELIS
jgi:hypothetical protein